MQTAAFRRRVQHSFLQQKRFYDEQCAPLFTSLHPNTLEWILTPKLTPLVRNKNGEVYPTMRAALDDHNKNYAKAQLLKSICGASAPDASTGGPLSRSSLRGNTTAADAARLFGSGANLSSPASHSPCADATSRALAGMGMTTTTTNGNNGNIVVGLSVSQSRDASVSASSEKKMKGKSAKKGKKGKESKNGALLFYPSTTNISLATPSVVSPTTSLVNPFAITEADIRAFDPAAPILGDDPHLLLSGMKWLTNAQQRLEMTRLHSFTHQNYEFEIGDVVYQKELGQVGVVADRLPVCFETDEWVSNQLGSSKDVRLRHPWYFLLVASHQDLPVDMTRYGSALTHVRAGQKMSIGFHSQLPLYFEGYDAARGVYIPRKDRQQFAKHRVGRIGRSQEISISYFLQENPSSKTAEEGMKQS